MKRAFYCFSVSLVFFLSTFAQAETVYKVDKAHSSVGFSVPHLVVSSVTGSFNDFDGNVTVYPEDMKQTTIDFRIDVASIDTNNVKRDEHLRGAEFFEANAYPAIIFHGKELVHKEGEQYLAKGVLTMKGVAKEVEVPLTIKGPVKGLRGDGTVIGIESHFSINRQEYNIKFNKLMDEGGLVVGDVVKVSVYVEAQSSPNE